MPSPSCIPISSPGRCPVRVCPRLALWLLVGSSGCGAGSPLLHPAHPLGKAQLSGSSGVSAHFAPGEAQQAIDAAGAQATEQRLDDPQVLVDGALAQTLSTPGLAPWFSVRAGLGHQSDAGISYTGRRVRADGRYVFVFDQTALSLGAGATGIMPDIGADPPTGPCDDPDVCPEPNVDDSYSEIPGLDTGSVSGFGFDLPVLFGWRSQPELISVWAGLRARYEDMSGEFRFLSGQEPRVARAIGSRLVFQGVFGLAVGSQPIWALIEVSPAFERISGEVDLSPEPLGAEMEGFSFSPAIALLYAP